MADRCTQHEYESVNYRDDKTRKCSSSRLCVLVLVVSCVCNAVLIGFLIHRVVWNTNSQHHDMKPNPHPTVSGSLCVSCDSLEVSNDVTIDSISYVTDSRLCCFKNSGGLSRLLSLLVSEFHTGSHVSTSDADFKARPSVSTSAHMYINLTSLKDTEKELAWSTEPGLGTAHVSGGITYRNGRYLVPRDGVYNVYSFLTSKTGDAVSVNRKLVHTVCRLRRRETENRKQVLLLDKMSRLEGSGVFSTSYLSASLNLQKNDEIYVEFSNASLIYTYPPANFFGIYQL